MHCYFVAGTAAALATPPPTLPTPRYTVDLDRPAYERWVPTLQDFLEHHGPESFHEVYSETLDYKAHSQPELFGPGIVDDTAKLWLEAFSANRPDASGELVALSSALLSARPNTKVFEPGYIALLMSDYVLDLITDKDTTDARPKGLDRSACTSSLVVGDDGFVLHGRSLDYESRTAMANNTIEVEFARSGVYQYTCMHPLNYLTALQWFTCVKPGHFSLSVNARGQGRWTEHNTSFSEQLRRVAKPGALLLGEVAEAAMAAESFAGALQVLSSSPVVSSNYFILAGAGKEEGAIVTRYGNHSSADVWALGSGSSDGQSSWFRVQTNVDHEVTFESGAYATHRRQHVINLLRNSGKHFTADDLWRIYEVDSGLDEASMSRMDPEDTGAILRPTTIASVVMRPALANRSLGARVWATDPSIHPPSPALLAFV